MLKITATGNLTNDVELKMNETTGKRLCLEGLQAGRLRRLRDHHFF